MEPITITSAQLMMIISLFIIVLGAIIVLIFTVIGLSRLFFYDDFKANRKRKEIKSFDDIKKMPGVKTIKP